MWGPTRYVALLALVLALDGDETRSGRAWASPLAAGSGSSAAYCSNTKSVVLTTCGDSCLADEPCVQYPAGASTKCSDAARNKCVKYSSDCTYQCLNLAFSAPVGKFTVFIKEPKASDTFDNTTATPKDEYPAAPIDEINVQFSEETKLIQINGFDNANVQKGSVKTVKLDSAMFEKTKTASSLALVNIDLTKLPTNFLPPSLLTLIMENCKLTDVPLDVSSMKAITTLNVAKNSIKDLPSQDNKVVQALQKLESLDLRANELTSFKWVLPELTTLNLADNQLTEFPSAIFNMTKLKTIYLKGNQIKGLTVTATQLSVLKRLTDDSTIGVIAATGSCSADQKEEKVLDGVVCVSNASAPAKESASGGSSSNTGLIIGIIAGVVVIIGAGAFLWHRRRSKAKSAFYVSVMENQTNNNTANNSTTGGRSRGSTLGRSRAPSAGRSSMAPSAGGAGRGSILTGGGTRGSRAPSASAMRASTINSNAASTYAEIGRYQEELQRESIASTQPSVSRQRERKQINQNVVRIASHDINYTRTIAKGAFGEVWLAHFGVDLVAVKKLLAHDNGSVGDFIAELNLLASLSHPRILALVGACWEDDYSDIQIITEYMDSGDLLSVLRAKSPTELTWENGKSAYCLQVCEAVFYLHSLQPALIHRDIKSRNILVDARKGAKLSDFGESRERTIQNTMTAGVGTARWVAPEIILGEDYSELADIYSLGVLLTELDTHQIPFEKLGLEEAMIVQQVAVGKLRPKVSDSCPEVIRRLAHECLQFDPQLRPSAARVLQTLMASPLIRRLSTISDNE